MEERRQMVLKEDELDCRDKSALNGRIWRKITKALVLFVNSDKKTVSLYFDIKGQACSF